MPELAASADLSFTEQLYVLSAVMSAGVALGDRPTPSWLLGRIKLLDGIALLLCTGPKMEATAITFEETGGGTNLFYSKIRPCTAKEKEYVSGLLEIFKNAGGYTPCVVSALNHIIPCCKWKIKSRLMKVIKELHNASEASCGQISFGPTEKFEKFIRKALSGSVPVSMSMEIFLRVFFDLLEDLDMKSVAVVSDFLEMAHFVATAPDINIVIPHPELVWRLQKFGNFFAAVKEISWITHFDREVSPRKKLITITEICPPPPVAETINGDPLQLINRFAEANGREVITLKALENAYGGLIMAKPPIEVEQPAPGKIDTFVHSELTLLNFMVQRRLEKSKNSGVSTIVEIGTSKQTCWACHTYMEQLEMIHETQHHSGPPNERLHNLNCVVSSYSGHLAPTWVFPPDTPKALDYLRVNMVYRELEHMISHVHENQKSVTVIRKMSEFEIPPAMMVRLREMFANEASDGSGRVVQMANLVPVGAEAAVAAEFGLV